MTTKAELIEAVAEALGESVSTTKPFVDAAFDQVTKAIIKGDSVRIVGFGAFTVKDMAERIGRNPATGGKIVIEAHKKLSFKPSPELKGKL